MRAYSHLDLAEGFSLEGFGVVKFYWFPDLVSVMDLFNHDKLSTNA